MIELSDFWIYTLGKGMFLPFCVAFSLFTLFQASEDGVGCLLTKF